MSFKLTEQVWGLDFLNSREKLLLLALSDHADDRARCWPSTQGLKKKCGCSSSTLNKTLKILKTAGLIKVTPRASTTEGRKTNLYEINHSSFHTPEMSDRITAARAEIKSSKVKNSYAWNNAPHVPLSSTKIHTGRNKSLIPDQVNTIGKHIDIEAEALEIAIELEDPNLAKPKASNGRYY